jgi:hypothetical protein
MSQLPRLLSLSGRKSSGKTELANICIKYDYTVINFADGLKHLVCKLLDIDIDYLNLNKDIELKIPYNINTEENINLLHYEINMDKNIIIDYIDRPFYSIRELLQIIGSEIIRKYNPLWHINKIKSRISDGKRYCLGDTRFLNEKKFIEDNGGECWFIIRPNNFEISNHFSETSLNWTDYNHKNIIINNISKNLLIENWDNYLCNNIITLPHLNEKWDDDKKAFLKPTLLTCYVAGLLMGQEQSNKLIKLESIDLEIIEKYKKILNTDRPIMNNGNGKEPLYSLQCNNPYVLENIKLWNVVPRNSMKEYIPTPIKLDIVMTKLWILGLIDINGVINNDEIVMYASNEIIEYIKLVAAVPCGVHANPGELKFNAKEFAKWIGHDNIQSFGLSRKWDKLKNE